MKLNIDVAGAGRVRQMMERIGRQAGELALTKTAEDVDAYTHHEAGQHTVTGALARSVFMRRDGDGAWIVGHDLQVAPHAVFVHWGTKPHKIRAKGKANGGKDLLRFVIGNRSISKREVNHPGYEGDAWLVRAARQAPRIFERHVETVVSNLSKE